MNEGVSSGGDIYAEHVAGRDIIINEVETIVEALGTLKAERREALKAPLHRLSASIDRVRALRDWLATYWEQTEDLAVNFEEALEAYRGKLIHKNVLHVDEGIMRFEIVQRPRPFEEAQESWEQLSRHYHAVNRPLREWIDSEQWRELDAIFLELTGAMQQVIEDKRARPFDEVMLSRSSFDTLHILIGQFQYVLALAGQALDKEINRHLDIAFGIIHEVLGRL